MHLVVNCDTDAMRLPAMQWLASNADKYST
jgi:hypothetical protein